MSINYTPRTWVAAEVVTAAEMNAEVRDPFTNIQAAWTSDGRASSTIWQAVTTNPVLNNGTIASRYRQIGKTIDWQVVITMGSTTTFGTGGWLLFLPVTALAVNTGLWLGRAYDVSVSTSLGYIIGGDLLSTANVQLRSPATTAGNNDRAVGATAPFGVSWATGDILTVNARYEAA